MSTRVCYLNRADRGDALAGVRLVGEHTDDSWLAPANPDGEFDAVEHVRLTAHAAGEWVANALRAEKKTRTIDTVCLDVVGSACAWVTAPSEQTPVVSAAYAQLGEGGVAVAQPELSTVEPMSSIQAGSGAERRVGLIASPDAVARLLLDELDSRGISVSRVCSLWQLLAQAWDPSGPGGELVHTRLREDRVVATDAPVSAIVMVEPTGRVVWSWSRQGESIAGGSMRVHATEEGCCIAAWDVSRLVGDWMSWSAQTGAAPSRVLAICPELDEQGSENALSNAEFGSQLGQAWERATVDLAVEADPLGETLARAARIVDGGGGELQGLNTLTRRPGRTHRSAYRWWALALVAGAATLATMTYNLYAHAGEIEGAFPEIDEAPKLALEGSVSHQEMASRPLNQVLFELRGELELKRQGRVVVDADDLARPVMPELLNIALALEGWSFDGVELGDVSLHPTVCRVEIWVPDSALAYNFHDSLIEGSEAIEWDVPQAGSGTRDLKTKYSFMGTWKTDSTQQ